MQRELPHGTAKQVAVQTMFDAIAPRYDFMNRLMTFRLDVGWRKRTVDALALKDGLTVADIACGTGDLCRDLVKAGLNPIGIDFSHGMLQAARTSASLVNADALLLPLADHSVDGVTCGFALRNFVDLNAMLREAARITRSGGRIALLEVSTPQNVMLKFGHSSYFGHVVPKLGALLSDADAYRYLPDSVAYLPPTNALLQMVTDAGYTNITRTALTAGIAQLITASKV